MSLSNYLENKILDKVFRNVDFTVATPYVSLHTADPGETGANEVTGGSYSRKSATFSAASNGNTKNTNNITFTSMPATTVVGVGIWDASSGGNCLWTGWLGGASKAFAVDDTTADTVKCPSHGFTADDRVVFEAEFGGTLPTDITAGTIYWVISSGLTTDEFKISTSQGGSAVNFTTKGNGMVRRVTPKILNTGDTFQINANDLSIDLF